MMKKTVILFLVTFFAFNVQAQRKTEIGLTGGVIGFLPGYFEQWNFNELSMDFGAGWSAGAFVEHHWKPRFCQIIEINYYSLNSKVRITKNTFNRTDGGYDSVTLYSQNESFPQLAISGGVKYFLGDYFFVYPVFEFSRALSSKVIANKTSYNLKLGAGFKIGTVSALLEFCHGLNDQIVIYSETPRLTGSHFYRYLQLKVQVPIYSIK